MPGMEPTPTAFGGPEHTHAPGNVGLAGDASCPACRAEGTTLTDEQRATVDGLLAALATDPNIVATLGVEGYPAAAVRSTLIEATLQGAEQERARVIARRDAAVEQYEAEARRRMREVRDDEPADAELIHAAAAAAAARVLRRFHP